VKEVGTAFNRKCLPVHQSLVFALEDETRTRDEDEDEDEMRNCLRTVVATPRSARVQPS